jgi:dTDP-4-amino-4,6-dideoxygalactose transaminase
MDIVDNEEIQEVIDVIKAGWLFRYGDENDPKFKAKVWNLEQNFASYVGAKHALANNSGTVSLLIALSAVGVGPGDEVIVPGYTFIASISSIIYARAIPVLAEVDETLNLDPKDVEAKITPRTKAIMVVHMLGNPARLDELAAIAKRHNLILIEDCAQATGASYRGKKVGTIGHAGTFSFNVFKTITTGDGGMMITNDDEIYRRAFAFHDQGHLVQRKGVEIGSRTVIGLDFRMTEITAAFGLAQLRKLDYILKTLRTNKKRLKDALCDIPGLKFRTITDEEGECATLLTIFLPDSAAAERLATELGTTVLKKSGWHVYSNMEQILGKMTITKEGCPFTCPYYKGPEPKYHKGMLPQTDDLLSRAINISIGVLDRGLSSDFGITIKSTNDEIDKKAEEFRRAVKKVL